MARLESETAIDGRDLLYAIRIGVRMPRCFGLRMWVATKLFELAGWVSCTNVVIEVDDGEDDQPMPFADAGLRGDPANWPWPYGGHSGR